MTISRTPALALPYPEGNEYVISGDDAIQALAAAVEDALTPEWWHAAPGAAAAPVTTTPTGITFAAGSVSGPFTSDGITITYTGTAPRWFSVTLSGTLLSPANDEQAGGWLYLYQGGVEAASTGSLIATAPPAGEMPQRVELYQRLQVTEPMLLHPGETVHAGVQTEAAVAGATIANHMLKITSTGPRRVIV